MRAAHRLAGFLAVALLVTGTAPFAEDAAGAASSATAGYHAIGAPGAAARGADAVPTGTVAVNRACYVNTASAAAKITITGSGWQAGATIELTDKLNELSATTTASTAGTFTYTVPAPVVDAARAQPVSDAIEAYYEGTPGETGTTAGADAYSAAFETTDYVVLVTGRGRNPTVRRTFALSGFAPGRTVYAHYLNARGTLLTTESFGRPSGPCGLRRVTAYEYPGGHPARGSYTVQFDDSARYARATRPQYRLSFSVPRA